MGDLAPAPAWGYCLATGTRGDMDWKLAIAGVVISAVGGFVVWRFRRSNFNNQLAPGCIMAFGILALLTGILTFLFSFWFKG